MLIALLKKNKFFI